MRLQGSGLSSKDRVRSVGRVFGRGRLDALRGLAFSRTQRGVLGFHANPFRPGQIIRGNAREVVRPIQRGPIAENLRAGGCSGLSRNLFYIWPLIDGEVASWPFRVFRLSKSAVRIANKSANTSLFG